jgi:putative flippase GtrA
MSALVHRLLAFDSGVLGQGMRYVLAGGVVSLVNFSTTTFLALVMGVPFQVALLIGFGVALSLHFTLQRVFVWAQHEEFALPLHHQASRYLALGGAQYGVTAASTSLLPTALGLPTEVVYLASAVLIALINFLVFRNGIFHAKPTEARLH